MVAFVYTRAFPIFVLKPFLEVGSLCEGHRQCCKEMSDLYVKAVVGRGSFGLVKLVYHKRDRQLGRDDEFSSVVLALLLFVCQFVCFIRYFSRKSEGATESPLLTAGRCFRQKYYALKCIGKKQVVQQKQEKSMMLEREINSQCYHPCIMHFITTFQDPEFLPCKICRGNLADEMPAPALW